jgi:hypothetical protein
MDRHCPSHGIHCAADGADFESQPTTEQNRHETTGDLVRLALGLGACLWMVIQVFSLPKDADAYRIWVYLGLIGIPVAMLLVAMTW